jgi:small-conductance mechanosensitive channel
MPSQLSVVVDLALPVLLAAAGLGAGLVVRRVLVRRSGADDVLVAVVRGPVVLLGAIAGLYLSLSVLDLPPEPVRLAVGTLVVLVIALLSWTVARLAAVLARRATARAGGAGGALPGATLVTNLARWSVLAVGLLIILQTLGISITPIITALGVGGLAVALALQDTLANLFAGIHILATRQVRPGDFVRLESGEEGYVQDITWRNTTIRQLPNNVTIVPNVKLAGAVITNYYMPEPELAVLVEVRAGYGSDLDHVERITIAVARDVLREVPGGVPDFEPFIRYHTLADSAVHFTVILRGREVVDQHLLRHEFIKRLHARYRAEGIEIPFPQRTVHVQEAERGSQAEGTRLKKPDPTGLTA